MDKLFTFLAILAFVSCTNKEAVEYVNGKQRLNFNDKVINGNPISVRLVNHGADTVVQGTELIFKIPTSDKGYKIVNAIFDCPVGDSSLVDTVSFKIDDCKKEFMVMNDTIFVAFKPNKEGYHQFEETIVGISRGTDGILRYHTGTFDYTVISND